MAISLKSLKRGDAARPPICVIYGKPGIGKTTTASFAPSPVFVQTEDGLMSPRLAQMPTFGLLKTAEEVLEALSSLMQEKHDFKTVVLDSLDRTDPLLAEYVCRKNGWKDIGDPQYGKGYAALAEVWVQIVQGAKMLRDERNMSVFMLGHHKQNEIKPPDKEPYTQYGLTLREAVARYIIGEADIVGFASHPVVAIQQAGKFGQASVRVADEGGPRLYVQERAGHVAKNRYDMPEYIPLSWPEFAKYIPFFAQQQAPAQAGKAA